MKSNLLIFSFILLIVSCKSINPEKPKFSGEPTVLPEAISRVNVPLEIPLDYIERNLNGELSELLYTEKGLNMGNGILADLDVNRTGDISLSSLGQNKLEINLPLQLKGQINIQKKIFGQSISTAVPFDEGLAPRVSFEPVIGRNWDIGISHVNIESWGRSLKYNLLGYEIDFGPMLKEHVEKMLDEQLTGENLSRISFKSMMEETWKAYGKPVKFEQDGIDAYIYTIPHKIKVREQFTTDQKLKLTIGIEGEVFTQIGSAPDISPSPLPNLYFNEDSRNYIDIMLPLSIPYQDLDKYLNDMLAQQQFRMDSKTVLTPKAFETQSFGDKALVKVDFTVTRNDKKDITGNIYLVGKPTYDPLREAIVFEDIDFDLNTKNILASSASWMKQGAVLEEMKKYAVYPIGEYIQAARLELQQQGYIETDYASFRVKRPALDVEGIYTTEKDIRLYLRSKGEMEVKLK
ncbi:hypothetical protein DN752_12425 [Echinicola strongylocentroti]|uniref:DUF4403 domain-containing protein n=1 Tax=Echinicola strongylocentroti TaxID=1795355 RepID=A0A2Z4IPR8_9BACT|nr:DUF4403 family protein [Echinicola strongylocentroti]AWW33161.1 hypothetical protein DN752_12425 [Echinicola strongylocentroti]